MTSTALVIYSAQVVPFIGRKHRPGTWSGGGLVISLRVERQLRGLPPARNDVGEDDYDYRNLTCNA